MAVRRDTWQLNATVVPVQGRREKLESCQTNTIGFFDGITIVEVEEKPAGIEHMNFNKELV